MQLAFYRGNKGTFFDRAICLRTGGPYSHVELVFSDPLPLDSVPDNLIDVHDKGGSLCYSSSSRVPRSGCGFQVIDLTDGKWDLVHVPIDAGFQINLAWHAIADIGRKYDWAAIMGFVMPVWPDDRAKRICSEECLMLLQSIGVFKEVKTPPAKISPNRLYRIATGCDSKS